MKKILKYDITPYVLIIFGIIFIIAATYSYKQPLSYELETSANPTVDNPVTITISIFNQLTAYTPEQLKVTTTHKYNTDESYEFIIDSYEKGKYQFIFTPHYSGDYFVNIEIEDSGKSYAFSTSISIEQ